MTEEVKRAREFAIKAHGDQMYGDEPYIVHLDEVAGILHEFGIMETIFTNAYIVAYLHDTIEDTFLIVTVCASPRCPVSLSSETPANPCMYSVDPSRGPNAV